MSNKETVVLGGGWFFWAQKNFFLIKKSIFIFLMLCGGGATEEQKNIAEKFIEELNNSGELGKEIVTEVKMLNKFYLAEDDHKNYYEKNKNQPYCQVIINPKLKKV